MKPMVVVTLLLALIAASQGSSDTDTPGYGLLQTGEIHGEDIKYTADGQWYGLFRRNGSIYLEHVNISMNRRHDSGLDQDSGTAGVAISIDQNETPVVLVRSPESLSEGMVSTSHFGERPIEVGKIIDLGSFRLTALGCVTDDGYRPVGDLVTRDYSIVLSDGKYYGRRQIILQLAGADSESMPRVIWAGDLDGDGKLDLLLDIRNHYAVRHPALYLSSAAEPGEMVRLVADLRIRSC